MRLRRAIFALFALLALLAASCGDDSDPEEANPSEGPEDSTTTDGGGDDIEYELLSNEIEGMPQLALVQVSDEVQGAADMAIAPGDDRIFVVNVYAATIHVLEDGTVLPDPFLDIGDLLAENGEGTEVGRGERGLLSLAFHPDYAENGRVFVWYADDSGINRLEEYTVAEDGNTADPDSRTILREFETAREHFGGKLQFGPDGYLYVGIGDGGERKNSNDLTTPRGSILRFDVSTAGQADPAPGNPYIDEGGGAADIWASGLRNPWRWSFDEQSGLIYVGDVGLDRIEEVSVHAADEAGVDYGWPLLEGSICAGPDGAPSPECEASTSVRPVIEMEHDDVCSVIGGVVYRGSAIPELDGTYFYSDFCGGFLRSFVYDGEAATEQTEWFETIGPVSSFGVDSEGEIYLTSTDGILRKLVAVS